MAAPTVTIEVGYRPHAPVHRLVFPANPDEQLTIDVRNTLIQTRIGAYYDQFGRGVPTLTLSGTTAWQSAQGAFDGVYCGGQAAALHLKRDIVDWYERHRIADQTPIEVGMTVVDEATRNVWTVTPITDVQFSQTQQAPLQVYFTLTLSVIQDQMAGGPNPPAADVLGQLIGQPTTRNLHARNRIHQNAKTAQGQRTHDTQIRTILAGETFTSVAQSVLGPNATAAQVQAEITAIEVANPALNPNTLPIGIQIRVPIPVTAPR